MTPWILVILAGFNSTLGNIMLKKSQEENNFVDSIFSMMFIGGCAFYLLNVLLFAYALKFLEVSKAYPVLATVSFVTLISVGFIFMEEALTFRKLLGILFSLIGIFILAS